MMKRVEFSDIFGRYLDPHKIEAAEWGAFAGLHGRNREMALRQVHKLAATALARAGLGATDRLKSAREGLSRIELTRAAVGQRLSDAYQRLIGMKHFNSSRIYRRIIEGAVDILAFPFLPLALLLSWPIASFRRWRCQRIENAEGAIERLAKAAEDYLAAEFDWYFAKGEEARRRQTMSRDCRPAVLNQRFAEDHYEENGCHFS
jgi:hypothetical protein